MTKKEHIDELYYMLKEHTNMNHKRLIEAVLNDVYNQIMFDTPSPLLRDFEFYTKEYEVSVSLDSNSNRYYSTLPVAVVNLKQPQQGVISINSKKGTGVRFWPVTERETRLYSNLETGLINTTFQFYLKRDRVYYTNYTSELANAGVRMELAVQFRDFEDTDEVPLPMGRDYDMKQLAIDYIKQNNIIDLQIPK